VSAFFYTGLRAGHEEAFSSAGTDTWGATINLVSVPAFPYLWGIMNGLRDLCKIDGSGCLW
jgi:hypothetical protein